MTGVEHFAVQVPDGRQVQVATAGPPDGLVLVFHTGTPGGLLEYPPITAAAATNGMRMVMYSRPGYGRSDPLPGRRVADAAADVAAVLDQIGATRFVTAGWSGGGPHALATAAMLADRCAAAATIAGVAPYPAPGLGWLEGMAEENVTEFTTAMRGESALKDMLATVASELVDVTAEAVAAAFGELVSAADRAALSDGFAEYFARSTRAALSTGIAGWLDDDLAFVRDWGFSLDQVTVPVSVWFGDRDAMVPRAHGEWLAAQIAQAQAHLLVGEGHLTLVHARIGEILHDLAQIAAEALSA
jgi:pimeloyl-ACP methyl ester carboxylesterase